MAPSTHLRLGLHAVGGSHSRLSAFLSRLSSFSSRCSCCDSGAVSVCPGEHVAASRGVAHIGAANEGIESVRQSDITPDQLGELREGADFAWLGLKSQHHISSGQACSELSPLSSIPFPSDPR